MGLTFEPTAHVYELDGLVVPSVTGVLKVAGAVNFDNIPSFHLEAARVRGTRVHEAIHYYNLGQLDVFEFMGGRGDSRNQFPEYAGYLQSWIRLMATGRLKTWLCEHRVASRVHGVAGTIDWLGEFDGYGAILDFATGNPEDAAKDLQTGAYEVLGREWAREPGQDQLHAFFSAHPFVRRFGVHLDKGGRLPTPYPYTDPGDRNWFIRLFEDQKYLKRRKPEAVDWSEWAA